MALFSIQFQRAHDIDWFARVNDIYIHAMSFGGLLPKEVNNREVNFNVLRHSYSAVNNIEVKIDRNDAYVDERIRRQARENDVTDFERRKERYFRHFIDMARKGFWSFDRDLFDEKKYHLIAKPCEEIIDKNWYGPRTPVIEPKSFECINANDWVLIL